MSTGDKTSGKGQREQAAAADKAKSTGVANRPAFVTTGRKVLRIGVIPSRQSMGIDEERVIEYGKTVTIGREAKNTFAFPSHAKLPETFTLFQPVSGKYTLRFSEKMDGKIIQKNGEEAALSDWKNKRAVKKNDLYELSLDETWRGKVNLGEITFLFSFVPEKKAVKLPLPAELRSPFFDRVDKTIMGIFAASFLIHATIAIIAFTRIVPEEEPEFEEGTLGSILVQPPPQVAEAEPEPEPGAEDTPVEAPKESTAPKENKPAPRPGDAGDPNAKKTDVSRVGALAALGRMSESGGMMADLFNDGSAEAALDNVSAAGGAQLATAGTDLGAGLKPGSGGGNGSGDIAGLDASDVGAKGANTAVTPSTKGPEKKVTAKVTGGGASIEEGEGGTLDSASITAVINRYKSGIQNCYERALVENENLQGKITVQFSISEAGRVVSATASDDTVGHPGVQSCVLGIISRLKFPSNEGGGIVKTNSTFVFAKNN